jgi:radical SAM superfamily enzyme YgiQ (UPF0313 family)
MKNYKTQLRKMRIDRLPFCEKNNNLANSTDINCDLKIVLIVPYNYEMFLLSAGIFFLENQIKKNFPNARVDFFFYYDFLFDHEGNLKNGKENVKNLYSFQYHFDLSNADILAFSFPNSTNYYHLLNILDIMRIPVYSRDRKTFDYPLIVLGNNSITNPYPFMEIVDAFLFGFVINEFIKLLQDLFLNKKKTNNKYTFIKKIESSYKHVLFNSESKISLLSQSIKKSRGEDYLYNNDPLLFISPVVAKDMILLFPNFGCKHKCSFCQFAYMKYHEIPFEKIKPYMLIAKKQKIKTIAINSLSLTQYTNKNELLDFIEEHELECIIGSFRPDEVDERVLKKLYAVNKNNLFGKINRLKKNSTLTMAPETPSCKTLEILNKGYTHSSIDAVIEKGPHCGYNSLCLYFMLGLPNENNIQDYSNIVDYVTDILKKNNEQIDYIIIKAHQFIPLPLTDLQRASMKNPNMIKKNVDKMKDYLKAQLDSSYKNKIEIQYEGPNRHFYEVITSRGGSEVGAVLVKMKDVGISPYNIDKNLDKVERIFDSVGLNYKSYFNNFGLDEALPWSNLNVVDTAREKKIITEFDKSYNKKEDILI